MHCENCGAEVRQGAKFCANCGAPTVVEPEGGRPTAKERLSRLAGRSRTERLLAVGTVIAAVIAIVAFLALDTEDDPKTQAFRAAADEQCVIAKREVAALNEAVPASGRGTAQVALTGGLVESVSGWWVAYDGLEPTSEVETEAEALDDALLALTIDLGRLSRTARTGSQAEIAAVAGEAETATGTVENAVSDLELTECAELSLGAAPTPG